MTRILLLNASPRGDQSHGYGLAMRAIDASAWKGAHVTYRDLVQSPIPPISAAYAHAITTGAPHDAPALDTSERLISELEAHDVLFIVTPMHNFTVPAALKLWLDHVIRINRSFTSTPTGKVGSLKDRPSYVLVSSGGFHVGERARQADFLTPYLTYALASIGIKNVRFFALQGLVLGEEAVRHAVGEAAFALGAAIGSETEQG